MRTNALVMLAALTIAPPLAAGGAVSLTDGKWELQGPGTAVEQKDGRSVLRVETGTASRKDVQLKDGTIDLDVMVTRRRSFVYLAFRAESEREQEEIYLRPHKSSLPDAVQYAPVYQGASAWQLHHGPGSTADLAFEPGVFQHLKLVLKGKEAALYFNGATTPVVFRLAKEPRAGYVALRGFLGVGAPGDGPTAWFTNVVVRPDEFDPGFGVPALPPVEKAAGIVTTWAVSKSFEAPAPLTPVMPDAARSAVVQRVEAEPSGLVELHRQVRIPEGARRIACVARLLLRSEKAGPRRLDLGFSDEVAVFLNGSPLYYEDDAYSLDRPRREGLIGFDQASLFLPLKEGENDLTIVVRDVFGGWGLMGRFPDSQGFTVEAPVPVATPKS